MRLKELKLSLAKYPPDMNDMEVIIVTGADGEKQYDLLCFVGYLPIPGHESVALGALSAVKVMVETGEIQKPDGYDEIVGEEFDDGE
jgi:hypothetical protein